MVHFCTSPWSSLTTSDLYDALALRQRVFVVEQNCVFEDCDGADVKASHVLGRDASGDLVAYARLFPAGVKYEACSIGRVVVRLPERRTGVGRALMAESIAQTYRLFGPGPIRIGAQRYLERFYASFGFEVDSAPYLEDGIWHVEMQKP